MNTFIEGPKYLIEAHYWDSTRFRDTMNRNLVIVGCPAAWLDRERARLKGSKWAGVLIEMCCRIGDDAPVSPEFQL